MPPHTTTASPFFHPSTPRVQVVRVQVTPGGTHHRIVASNKRNNNQECEAKSTMIGCGANLMNAIVGAGIVGIAYAVRATGLWAGIFLILLCAFLTDKSLRLLVATAKHAHTASYETLAEAAFGLAGFRFVAINMFVMAYGAMLSYLMIVKDTFPTLLGMAETDVPRRRAVLWLISCLVIVPLACQRDMANLSFTSRVSVVLDTILVSMVMYNAPVQETVTTQMGGWTNALTQDCVKPNTLFVGLGVLSFAFVCQHSAFLIAGSLERPTVKRWSTVTQVSLSFCAILALAAGLFGYLGYYDQTQGNILRNLPNNFSSNLARAMLGTTMLFVYPMESFVARHVCVSLFFKGRRAHEGNADADILQRFDRRVGLTMALYLATVIPASLAEDLGNVLALTGAIGGSSLCYLGPGAVYLGIHGERFLQLVDESSWLGAWHKQQTTTQTNKRMLHPNGDSLVQETTPLVARERLPMTTTNGEEEASSWKTRMTEGLQTILAYALWMPLWCFIAAYGKQCLGNHMHDMTLKSPYPLRIGDIEYKRIDAALDNEETEDLNAGSSTSKPFLKNGASFHGAMSINQQIGQQLLLEQKQKQIPTPKKKKTTSSEQLEPDPQENPTASDFIVAIAFCLLGAVALVAGLLSLAVEQE
jgi:sodium-coupled neutral amino acid transporter 11